MQIANLSITKLADKPATQAPRWGVPIEELLGHWENVKENTQLIHMVDIEMENDKIYITAFGKGEKTPIDWGKQLCHLFYDAVDSNTVEGLMANYDFGFMENLICFNAKKGVLTIQSYSIFKDNSGRKDYFGREFFTKV